MMRRLLALAFLLAAGPALAADNYNATEGGGKVFRCVDNAGVCSPAFLFLSGAVASGAFSSGAIASGAIASGAIASGAVASGAYASGAFASGSIASGAMVDLGAVADAAATAGSTGTLSAKLRLMTTQLGTINTTLGSPFQAGGSIGNTTFAVTNAGTFAVQAPITSWGGGTLGAMANYGASPGAVLVPGVNAFVTNSNNNGSAVSASSSPVVIASDQAAIAVKNNGGAYETIAASQTAQVMGATGATGDYLSHCVIYPATTSPGVVTVFDNTNAAATNVIVFAGGASSTSNLTPIPVPVGAISTAGAWKVTTGANVSVVCYGKFT